MVMTSTIETTSSVRQRRSLVGRPVPEGADSARFPTVVSLSWRHVLWSGGLVRPHATASCGQLFHYFTPNHHQMATFAAHGGHNSEPAPVSGREYLIKLRKYLGANLSRLAPAPPPRGKPRDASWLQQSYTVFTLGLDPNSAPLSRNVKIPLTLGFGTPSVPPNKLAKPVLLRLPPDKLLYLLLRWQSLPQQLNHVGHTDVPVPEGVAVSARGARAAQRGSRVDGDVDSVRSWVGSIRSVSMRPNTEGGGGFGWWSKPKTVEEGE